MVWSRATPVSPRLAAAFAAAAVDNTGDALARILGDESLCHGQDWQVMLECYVLARRRGDIREVLYDWMDQIRQLLSSHLPHARDPEIDDLLTSLILHCPSGLERSDPDWIRRAVRGLISVRRQPAEAERIGQTDTPHRQFRLPR